MAKAIFLDIDGTLILWEKGPFAEDIEQIEAAREAGHHIFLCTGRSLGNIPQVFRNAPYIDGMITGCGARVLFRGKTLYHTWIPQDALLKICGYYLRNEKWCVFEGERQVYGINLPDAFRFAVKAQVITGENDFFHTFKDAGIEKTTIQGFITDEERALMGDILTLNPFPDYFEGILKGESKSRGIERLIQDIGVNREDTVAIGDSLNDLDMIQYAGLGIAMGNACEELKAAARFVTADCEHAGVGRAIRQWVL